MGLGAGIWLMVLGILGASNLIIAKRPDAKEHIAKLAPYQGWIGASSVLWGLWIMLWSILNAGILITWALLGFITLIAVGAVLVVQAVLFGASSALVQQVGCGGAGDDWCGFGSGVLGAMAFAVGVVVAVVGAVLWSVTRRAAART